MSFNSSMMYHQFILNFYTSLNLSNSKLIDTCYKISSYDSLNYFIENIAKANGVDIKFIHSVFKERNPAYPDVPSIKEIIETSRSKLVKEDIDINDFENFMKSKDDIIKDTTVKLKAYETVISNLNSTIYQYEQYILQMKGEITKKNLQLAAYNTNVYFQPSISPPPGLGKEFFPPLSPTKSNLPEFTGSCFKPETKLKENLLNIFKKDIWNDTKV